MSPSPGPDWNQLYEAAAGQQGLFTTSQAVEAGYSNPLITHHVRSGRFARLRRGIYRLIHFPAGEHEDLVEVWLWSEHEGVFSHQTALALQNLSDVLPKRVHLTVPIAWQQRRLRVPKGVVLHFGKVPRADRAWVDAVPITNPGRTLRDCAEDHFSPELLEQAVAQARHRGLVPASFRANLG